ncbi:family 20 glycosylhydrolase [Sphingobacterium corticis]|uniref:beta-N-acetylhexosaminidase n=1 Tax=Sphingobacterium corticis TaxID=1812823 RepID=A0ABW5NJM0_9SPHI
MKKISLAFCAYILAVGVGQAQEAVHLHWRFSNQDTTGKQFDLTVKNNGGKAIDFGEYDLWFNSNYHLKDQVHGKYKITDQNGNLYRVSFQEPVQLAGKDSLVITYVTDHPITHTSFAPNGFYLQSKQDANKVIALKNPSITVPQVSDAKNKEMLGKLFDKNALFNGSSDTQFILPTPQSITRNNGQFVVKNGFNYFIDPSLTKDLSNSFASLNKEFSSWKAKPVKDKKQAQLSIQKVSGLADDAYKLSVNEKGIRIEASHAQGAFYGLQSLISLIPGNLNAMQTASIAIPFVEVNDAPRYGYRGLMLDISRNFKDLSTLKRYVDVMARYKLNKLHLHFIDDEGWRLEIPSLPELTAIGANRTPQYTDGNSIQPSYGSGAGLTGKQYLTKTEFQELLRYAADRFVTVVPEVETPGHARAAVKAMETRYHRLIKEGNKKEAERFLMNDFADSSKYYSAQYWQDNVMNPAMPGTYHFIAHVLDEIKAMYQEAGLELKVISIGGDELPNGSWEGSPLVQALMKEKGMTSVHEVWPYYIARVHEILAEKQLTMAGWEEVGMVNRGKGMEVNEKFADKGFMLDVWNNTIGGGQEDLAYKLANAGHNTVFISASNFYFDMVWDNHFEEPGLTWASKTDLYHAYSLLPETYFANILYTDRGKPLGESYFKDKTRLSAEGVKHLVGLKGALWQETVLDEEAMDYMIFPRFFALAERAWAPQREWESEEKFDKKAFDKTYTAFINKVGNHELPKLKHFAGGFHYRLPAVGLKEENGKLHANAEYPGFPIQYKLNGSAKGFPKEGLNLKAGERVEVYTIDSDGRTGRVSNYAK